MKKFELSLGLEELSLIPDTRYQGDKNLKVDSVSTFETASSGTVVFLEQEKLFEAVKSSPAGLIITTEEFASRLDGRNLLITPKPYLAIMTLITMWQQMSPKAPAGIHPSAIIEPGAQADPSARIQSGVVIGENSIVEKDCHIGAGCVIGKNVRIGAGSVIHSNVCIYEDCVIGRDVIIHSGAVIGADGFGFALIDGIQRKIPQIGNVIIEDHAEIGANTCIDRATLGSTIIGEGSKLDNLVQIGHNCIIGRHCIICAQVGLAGSTTLGDYVYLAGQVGAAGHMTIGDRSMVGAQSGITNNIPPDTKYFGTPALDANLMKRIMASQKKLPEIYRFYLRNQKEQEDK